MAWPATPAQSLANLYLLLFFLVLFEGEDAFGGVAPQLDVGIDKSDVSSPLFPLRGLNATVGSGTAFIAATVPIAHVSIRVTVGVKAGVPPVGVGKHHGP